MAESRSRSWNTKLAQAESLLILALLMDALLTPWVYANPDISPLVKTVVKMALIVGLFGPLFDIVKKGIDGGINTTHKVTRNTLSLSRIGAHILIISGIFLVFYWTMHHHFPWSGWPGLPFTEISESAPVR